MLSAGAAVTRLAKTLSLFLALALAVGCNSTNSSSVEPTRHSTGPTPPASTAPADPRERALTMIVGRALESDHLRHRPIDDQISEQAFDRYLDRLDPGKLFLLQQHVATLKKYRDRVDDEIHGGSLPLAHLSEEMLASRIAVVAKTVDGILQKPFDFTRDEQIETDSEKEKFCATEAELTDRWRKTLKLQVLERVARMEEQAKARAEGKPEDDGEDEEQPVRDRDPIPTDPAGREQKARADLTKSYAARFARMVKIEPLDGVGQLLNAVISIYDPHTLYMPPATKANFDIEMSGTLEGIGAVLQEDDSHYIRVVQIVPGGASWRQGKLEANDLILTVAQKGEEPVDVYDMRIDNVVKMIRGPKGTKVTLSIEKPDGKVEQLTITRDVVEIETGYARAAILSRPGLPSLGYIYLPSFYGNTRDQPGQTPERSCSADVRTLLELLTKRKVGGVILDLRGNGGGLLDDAREISGLFIPTGPIVETRDGDGDSEILRDRDPSVSFAGPVVVLVDKGSASASEILAAALQDYHRAVVVGAGSTHGKGTVQVVLDLDRFQISPDGPPLGVLKLTYQQFFRVTGSSTQWRGVIPDIELPDPYGYLDTGERSLDNSIPWSEVEPLPFAPWSPKWKLPELVRLSQQRRTAEPVFATIEQRNHLLRERRKQTVVPLGRAAWDAQRASDRAALDKVSVDLDATKARFTLQGFDYAGQPLPSAGKSGGQFTKEQYERWRKELSHDPWVDESMRVLSDMIAGR